MRRSLSIFVILSLLASACSTTGRKRILIGAGIGGAVGAVGGNVLSPNDESRGVNALVFGLAGALVGGILGSITDSKPESASNVPTLKERDLGVTTPGMQEYLAPANQPLPQFVKDRLEPVVIEEFSEPDAVSEDGVLHEPHRAYRIKRPSELFARPIQPKEQSQK